MGQEPEVSKGAETVAGAAHHAASCVWAAGSTLIHSVAKTAPRVTSSMRTATARDGFRSPYLSLRMPCEVMEPTRTAIVSSSRAFARMYSMSFMRRDIPLKGKHCQPLQGEGHERVIGAIFPSMGTNLRNLRIARGWTHEEAAQQMGISRGQFIKLERGERQLTDRTIALAAKAFGVTKGEIVDDAPTPRPRTESTVEELPAGDAFTFAKVDGSVQAGAFLAVEAFDDDLGEVISAPRDPAFPFARQIAYRVKGDSMNRAQPKPMNEGDYIICAAWEDVGLKEKDGLNVVVQQTTADGQLRERSVKEMRVFPDRFEFHPRSSNPAHKPIVVDRQYHTDDGKEVTVLALVRFVFDNQALPI